MRKALIILAVAVMLAGIPIAASGETVMSLQDATKDELIGKYLYLWDNAFQDYRILDPNEADREIKPFESFFVEILPSTPGRPLNIEFEYPGGYSETKPRFPFWLDSGTEGTLYEDKWYAFTLPIDPTAPQDIKQTFIDWSAGKLSEDNFDSGWMVFKYNYKHAGEPYSKMLFYGEPEFITNNMVPGQGYFFEHLLGEDTTFKFVIPYPENTERLNRDWRLNIPYADPDGSGFTLHHVGNPFWVKTRLSKIKIIADAASGTPLAKPAAEVALNSIRTWHVGLKLESSDHTFIDQCNRAGAAVEFSGNTRPLCALDLIKPGDYVRVALKNPSSEYNTEFAYDIRPSGQNEYSWIVELTTTRSSIDATLSLDDFSGVPEEYRFTLSDGATGSICSLDGPQSFPVTLTAGEKKTFVLTATRKPTSVSDAAKPASFGITRVSPNPFNPATSIGYSLAKAGNVTVKVYNMNGQVVDTLLNTTLEAGNHSVSWNAARFASGVYFIQVRSNGLTDSRKVTLAK